MKNTVHKNLFMIPKNYLPLIAGIVWVFAGFMVCKTGFPLLLFFTMRSPVSILAFIGVFLFFYLMIFRKLVYKHIRRIRDMSDERTCFWLFFDLKSYTIMIVMMSFGIVSRKLNLFPAAFIGPFYSGLGFALFSCGVRFITAFSKKYVLQSEK
ncbi:hypothetical protein H0R92_03200 [Treponema sp. OMZ 840]|uniref:hypothetical protein n=1 Tax=Treponema sp. OMZ 840 TaxID=244313 RepID=UPI003D9278A5